MKKLNKSRSRSPRAMGALESSFYDEIPEKGTVKMGQEEVPAWYKTLKRQVGK